MVSPPPSNETPWTPAQVGAATGRFTFHSGERGRMQLSNVGSFLAFNEWTAGLAIRFNYFPATRAFFFSLEGVGLFIEGNRIGLFLCADPTKEDGIDTVTSPPNIFIERNSRFYVPGSCPYVALSCQLADEPGAKTWQVYVAGKRVINHTSRVIPSRTFTGLFLGGGFAFKGFRGSIPTAGVDCDILFYQSFQGPRSDHDHWIDAWGGFNWEDETRRSFYDFTQQPPRQVMDMQAQSTFPRRDFQVYMDGTATQGVRGLLGLDTLVAIKLAPIVQLHSEEQHFPCAVEWYFSRSRLVRNDGNKPTISPPRRFAQVDPMKTIHEGPVDGSICRAAAHGQLGGQETDNVFLWPREAAPGTEATWPGDTPFRGTFLSAYQLDTTYGLLPSNNECDAPCYCHIVAVMDNEKKLITCNITYHFFYSYNGGLAGGFKWHPTPLDMGDLGQPGWGAHFGDWERATAKVRIYADSTCELLSVILEQHGTPVDAGMTFSRKDIETVEPLKVYSAWHSHASYATAGEQRRFPANDFTDSDGAAWRTAGNLVFIGDRGPDWVYFNGDWGPRIVVAGGILANFEGYLEGGPQGPAFHDSWSEKP